MGSSYEDFTGKLLHQPFASNTTAKSVIVSAPGAGKRLRVHGHRSSAAAAVGMIFYNGLTGATLAGTQYLPAGGVVGEERSGLPCFDDLSENQPLVIALSAEQLVGGIVHYREV